MLDVIANQASARGESQLARVTNGRAFLGYTQGQADFGSYQLSAMGSSQCNDLTEVSLADYSFAANGSVARTTYNQFHGVSRINKAHIRFIRHQRPGDLRVGGTDFFTVAHP